MADVFAVRREVFVVEQDIPEEEEMDAYDVHAVHLLATGDGGEGPLGTVRILHGEVARKKCAVADGVAVLGRLAVRKAARGTGAGVALVRAVERHAGRLGLTEVYLEAQVSVIGFYERLGYRVYGPEFDDGSGIMHRRMSRAL